MNERDIAGHYAALGIGWTATAEEIKAAYRALAKVYHPDRNPDPTAEARFQRISAAYATLGDPEKRKRYDQAQYRTPGTEERSTGAPRHIEPITCSRCKKVTAQPRYAVYWTVISAIIATWRTPSQGIFCAACARGVAFRCSAISSVAGWWGVWGIVWTPKYIIENSLGGGQEANANTRLLWYNALAFLSQGNLKLAHALARKVASTDTDLALDAADLLSEMHRSGISRDTAHLADPWKRHWGSTLSQMFLGLAVPALAVFMMASEGEVGRVSDSNPGVNSWNQPTPISPDSENAVSSGLEEEVPPAVAQPPPICAEVPEDGALLEGALHSGEFGHKIVVRNGSSGPAIIKVRDAASGKTAFAFYVSQGSTASASPIPDGRYRIQYAFGDALGQDCKNFNQLQGASEFPSEETFIMEERGTSLVASELSYTLYNVPGGNVRPESIDPAAFLSD